MECDSCKVIVPAEWKKAIQRNVCPNCEGVIMSEASKNLMDELRAAIERMPSDTEGLVGWLMSTYTLTPKGTVEPTAVFYDGSNQRQLKHAQTPTQFAKNAGVDKIVTKNAKFAELASAINNLDDPYQSDNSISAPLSSDEEAELARLTNKLGRKPTMQEAFLASDDSAFIDPNASISKEETQIISEAVSNMTNGSEFLNKNSALGRDRLKRLQTQVELSNGGVGKIRRSE
jgi:hypothetical protein